MSVYFFKCTFSIKVQKKSAYASCGIFSGDSYDFTSPDEVGLTLPRSTLRRANLIATFIHCSSRHLGEARLSHRVLSDSLGQSCNVVQNGSSLFKPHDSVVFILCRSSNPTPPSSSFIPVSDINGRFPFHVPPRPLPPIRTLCSMLFKHSA